MPTRIVSLRSISLCGLALAALTSYARAVQPGVDIATPRVVICTVGSALAFNTPSQVIEQGDYVSWRFTGTLGSHTTTSGGVCLMTTGLWDAPLNSTSTQFDRQFLEAPSMTPIPYHCTPHCGLGMKGSVTVTTTIDLSASDTLGTLSLTWSGGGGTYEVFRSDVPSFSSAGTVTVPPDGGGAGTSFTDMSQPVVGMASFYLVMNKQP